MYHASPSQSLQLDQSSQSKLKEQRGVVVDPFQANGWTASAVAEMATDIANKYGIPANISVDQVTTGGLFGQQYPCVVIKHPSQPYFDQWVVINGNIINVYYGGYSKANYNTNLKEQRSNSGKLSGMIMGALMQDSSMDLQTERMWHDQIIGIYKEIWFPDN